MTNPPISPPQHGGRLRRWWPALTALAILAGAAIAVVRVSKPGVQSSTSLAAAEAARTNLVLQDNRLHLRGRSTPFSGWMVEHYASGTLRSRSSLSNGLLHGLSQGWHTNGQLQVEEHFVAGTSHGVRTKWYPGGAKLSEATIADGKLNGPFRRWHENGALSEQVDFVADRPDGVALAYHPDGSLKAEVLTQAGKPIEQRSWKQGHETDPTHHQSAETQR